MSKLWKITMMAGILLGAISFLIMVRYSSTKSVVITEEHELTGEGNLEPLTQEILAVKDTYNFLVLINAAHGGENQGNAVNELQEKEITLEVGRFLEEMSTTGDIGLFMIRQEDTDISNENRAKMIDRIKPDLVVDLHVNADPVNERTYGTSVVYNEQFYRPGLTNAAMADIMERNLVEEIQGKALGIIGDTQNKYPLLSMLEVPVISVEMGYLTNKQEADLLKKEKYQKSIATGIYQGILEIREKMPEGK